MASEGLSSVRNWAVDARLARGGRDGPTLGGLGRGRGGRAHVFAAERRRSRSSGQRGFYRWTDEQLEAQLRVFTAGMAEFPPLNELTAAGRGDLRSAVTDHGGVAYWAERIEL